MRVKRIRGGFAREFPELLFEDLQPLCAGYRVVLHQRCFRTVCLETITRDCEVCRTADATFPSVDGQVKHVTQIEADFVSRSTHFAFFCTVKAKAVRITDVLYTYILRFSVRLIQQDIGQYRTQGRTLQHASATSDRFPVDTYRDA